MPKAKGAALVGTVIFLRKRRDDAKKVLPPELHHYLEERIVTTSWYPEEDLLALIRAMGRLMPSTRGDVFELIGRLTLRAQADGIYTHLATTAKTAEDMHRRAVALWASQHDTGSMSVTVEEPGVARFDVVEFGLPSKELCSLVRGYVTESFRVIGGRDPEVETLACQLEGADRCAWRFRYAAPETDDARARITKR